ncbi:molybdate ABC transporter substrate-binding protein [Kordiimonas aestuarii]|uniref:molybdate ABC transporter substrate-binding protein n=1 Tax=Kordiimonas aestuarii TaxID=1005925 RepID=UPI0021D2380C|nr:molybdate ABC transporter substrate-binding protein [Kordiimonas aestuarii]
MILLRDLLLVCFLLGISTPPTIADDEAVTVFAAASLTNALPELAQSWADATGYAAPRISFGPSAMMARQVAAGAPAHIMLSANPDWVAFLQARGLLASSPKNVVQNRLVLVQPGSGAMADTALTTAQLEQVIGSARFAIADPTIAPAGAYARSYLEHLNLWEKLKPQAAMGTSVRQTLVLVERGGMPGFVYASDARLSSRVDVVGVVPGDNIPPILYAAGRTKKAGRAADSLFIFLVSEQAAQVWKKYGFAPIVPK